MSRENKALVRRFYEEIDKGNVEATLHLATVLQSCRRGDREGVEEWLGNR
jgi:hypothetical protein